MANNYRRILYILSVCIIALFLVVFLYETHQYQYISDDIWINNLLSKKGLAGAYLEMYTQINGRWFSHFWELIFFKLFRTHTSIVYIYQVFLLILFIASNYFLTKQITHRFIQTKISASYLLLFSTLFTSLFFFFFWEGRVEVWYWLSSLGVHLISLIVMQLLFALAIQQKRSKWNLVFLILCAGIIGGTSETNCIICILFVMLLWKNKWITMKSSVLILICLTIALLGNIVATGLWIRLNLVPHFQLLQAVKNTIHSMLLPFMAYRLIPLKLFVLVFTYLVGKMLANRIKIEFKTNTVKEGSMVIGLIFISFFIPCFLLSDITALRMQSFAYFLFLAFILKCGVSAQKKAS